MNQTVTASPTAAAPGKYLTFVLGHESYGIAVMKVREIIRLVEITPVPQMPDYIRGVVNLRGKIIPIVDLRLKFELPEAPSTERACIIVVQVVLTAGQPALMGVIVDGVEEVSNIMATEIEPTPDFGASLDTACIIGMAKSKTSVKTLLDIDKLLSSDAAQTGTVS